MDNWAPLCITLRRGQPSTAGSAAARTTTGAVHSAPHRRSCPDGEHPQRPQDLLLLLVFSFQEEDLKNKPVDARSTSGYTDVDVGCPRYGRGPHY
ncbi:MAG: hypothetical protein ACRDRQ_01580 [Pseudonocardiaceae bacterium]